ncbi:MAG: hypothetical protein LBG93_04455 [Treponema sp.]|jgi:multicomponent Na+:H+ antiporter subunit D|nr:hypothetical protein [Treponema sp.]
MSYSILLTIPILLPVLSGLFLGLYRPLREKSIQRLLFTGVLAINVFVVVTIILRGNLSAELFRLTDNLPIMLKTDDLARLFCGLAAAVFFLVGIYSPVYLKHEGNQSRFYMFFLLVLGMVMGFGFSANFITLYLFFEMATLLSMPLVLHSMKKEAISAAFKYVYFSIAGAALSLISIFFIFSYGTTLEFQAGGVLDMERLAGSEGQMLFVSLLAIIGFGAKAGMFPLHAWLPIAHPVAPAPASAILSGLITKVGIFAVIRYVYYIVGPDFISGTWVQTVWLSLALFTGIMGSLLAFIEPALKRRLAYSTISQVGYIMFALAILSASGFVGALLQIVFHSTAKNAVFLVAGIIIIKTHKTEIADLRGVGKQMPAPIWAFALASLSLVGIPPMAGFTGKWFLATSSLVADTGIFTWLGPVVLLASALLAAAYLMPIVINGFFPGSGLEDKYQKTEVELSMLIPVLIFAAAALVFGMFPNSLIYLFERIAASII